MTEEEHRLRWLRLALGLLWSGLVDHLTAGEIREAADRLDRWLDADLVDTELPPTTKDAT